MAGYFPYESHTSYQSTSYFPQPQGNVYMVNNSLEVANIPMTAGLSAILCPSEEALYIKTLQGGTPTLMVYRLSPFQAKEENNVKQPTPQKQEPDLKSQIEELAKQVQELSKQINGGKIDELL